MAALEVAVADGAVEVEGTVLDVLEELEVQGALVDLLHDRHPRRREERRDVPDRIEESVHAVPDAVTDGERLEAGEHEVRPGAPAVHAEGLAGVGVAAVDVELRLRDIEEADHTDRGVHAEARDFATRAAEATLEKVVHQAPRHAEVVEGAIEPPLPDVGEGLVPSLGDRFQEVSVEDVVIEKEHLLVEVLPWVVVVGCSVLDVRGGRGLVRPGGTHERGASQHDEEGEEPPRSAAGRGGPSGSRLAVEAAVRSDSGRVGDRVPGLDPQELPGALHRDLDPGAAVDRDHAADHHFSRFLRDLFSQHACLLFRFVGADSPHRLS